MSKLSAATEAYQVLLEGHRAHPDDEGIWEQFQQAEIAMNAAWLEYVIMGADTNIIGSLS